MAQWHPTRNQGFTPEAVTCGSAHRAWWLCQQGACGHDHEWQVGPGVALSWTSACLLPWAAMQLVCKDREVWPVGHAWLGTRLVHVPCCTSQPICIDKKLCAAPGRCMAQLCSSFPDSQC